jgi:hypothetical protein
MRTETITKTYLQFNELSEAQQNKVIDNFREDMHHDFDNLVEDIYENFKILLDCIGFEDVEINYTGFSSQGDGASFTGTYRYTKYNSDIIKAIKAANVEYILDDTDIYNMLSVIESKEESTAVYRMGHYYHECSIYCDDNNVQELARALSILIYKELESQYDYLHTDEYINESINCNEYEFDKDTLEIA